MQQWQAEAPEPNVPWWLSLLAAVAIVLVLAALALLWG